MNEGQTHLATPISDNQGRSPDGPFFKTNGLKIANKNLEMEELPVSDRIQEGDLLKHAPKKHVTNLDYDPLAIPADWNIAVKHAQARRVAIDNNNDEVCPCCGYEVNRISIGICETT